MFAVFELQAEEPDFLQTELLNHLLHQVASDGVARQQNLQLREVAVHFDVRAHLQRRTFHSNAKYICDARDDVTILALLVLGRLEFFLEVLRDFALWRSLSATSEEQTYIKISFANLPVFIPL